MCSTKNVVAKTLSMHSKAKYWIDQLDLKPHPEGGHYKEVFRSEEIYKKEHLPERFGGDRSFSTSIYYLLQKGEKSAFHRIKSDETWYFHDGDDIEIYLLDEDGVSNSQLLGLNPDAGSFPQFTVEKNCWFAAKPRGDFALVSCNVAPGFDFKDFELANKEQLTELLPNKWSDLLA